MHVLTTRCLHAQEHQDCPEPFLHGLNYSQVAGLIGGMVTVGMFIDRIGRKWGSVTTAGIMFVGAREQGSPGCCALADACGCVH